MRPLYTPLSHDPNPASEKGNTGLWYDKFCNTWPEDCSWSLNKAAGKDPASPKHKWIQTVTRQRIGDKTLIREACARQQLLASANGITARTFTTTWRFVTGLGRQHPVENGFVWHHTLGAPYLPGSSVKGMVRAWAEQWEENPDCSRIFGSRDKKKAAAGNIIFLDALPTGTVRLEEDIMTPHYSPYYQDGSIPPGDWYDPNPIPFLTVAAGQEFQFVILSRRMDDQSQVVQDAEQAYTWLLQALEYIGAGAKTAVGYGRFRSPGIDINPNIETELWRHGVLQYTPNTGQFTLMDRQRKRTALCPEKMCSQMKKGMQSLSAKKKKKLRSFGLPCEGTVAIKGNLITVRQCTVTWSGAEKTVYAANL